MKRLYIIALAILILGVAYQGIKYFEEWEKEEYPSGYVVGVGWGDSKIVITNFTIDEKPVQILDITNTSAGSEMIEEAQERLNQTK